MKLTIDIPDAIAPQVIDNICAATNFPVGGPDTKAAWAKKKVIDTIKNLNNAGAMKTARNAQVALVSTIS
jgi:hypothetical protein